MCDTYLNMIHYWKSIIVNHSLLHFVKILASKSDLLKEPQAALSTVFVVIKI